MRIEKVRKQYILMKKDLFYAGIILITLLICQTNCIGISKPGNDEDSSLNTASGAAGIPVIYETDMTMDVDDVGGLAVLHAFAITRCTLLGLM